MNKSTAEMWELASTLYLHGANEDKLSALLPHWQKSDIAAILRRFKGKARRERYIIENGRKAFLSLSSKKLSMKIEKSSNSKSSRSTGHNHKDPSGGSFSNDPSLLAWSELLKKLHTLEGTSDKVTFGTRIAKSAPINDHSQLLSKVMLYASSLEDHYQKGNTDEASYSEIYRYLSQLLEGKAPVQLRPKSAAKILEMVDRLTTIINSGEFKYAIYTLQQKDLSNIEKFEVKPTQASSASSAEPTTGPTLFEEIAPSVSATSTSTLREQLEALDSDHPYFEEIRSKINAKLIAIQSSAASRVVNVPGMNPLKLPPDAMIKPLEAFESTYPCRNQP